ncbi:MAG: hypothetical protein J7K20_02755 [Thermodesulfobacterium sp.]|nr:hypothetical protein [Thermodesulfobacterium sp.]
MKLSQIVFPKFKKFPHLKATLNFYLNFVKSPQGKTGYYYRALFSCESKKDNESFQFLLIEHIPVEFLTLIPSGYIYFFDSGKIAERKSSNFLKSAKIDLFIPENQEVKRLSEYVEPKKFHEFGFLNKDGQYISFEREISSLYIVKIEHNNATFLIPSTLIASQFYFFSSRIIPYMLRNALGDTHKGITMDGNSYKIVMGSYFSSADAPKVIFFLTDPYAKDSLTIFSSKNLKNLLKESLKFPIYARFPFNGTYPCEVFYEMIGNYCYVHFLGFARGSLPYEKLNVEVIRVKIEKAKENEVEVHSSIPIGIPEELEEAEYELSRVKPSKYLKSLGLRTALEQDRLNVKKGILLSNDATPKAKPVFFKAESKVEMVSVEDKAKPYSEMEKKTAKIEVTRGGSVTEGDYEKNLEKFKELLQVLQDQFKFEIRFMKELLVPIRKKNKDSISQIEYYDWRKIYKGKNPNRRRKFLLVMGKFPEVNNLVAFLEVDQTGMSYSLSTFVFITKMKNINLEFLKKSVIYFLVERLEGLKEEQLKKLMESRGIEVYFKKHPSVWSKRAIVSWCRRVKKIIANLI